MSGATIEVAEVIAVASGWAVEGLGPRQEFLRYADVLKEANRRNAEALRQLHVLMQDGKVSVAGVRAEYREVINELNAATASAIDCRDRWVRRCFEARLETRRKDAELDEWVKQANAAAEQRDFFARQAGAEAAQPIRLGTIATDDRVSVEIVVCDEHGDVVDREVRADAVLELIEELRREAKRAHERATENAMMNLRDVLRALPELDKAAKESPTLDAMLARWNSEDLAEQRADFESFTKAELIGHRDAAEDRIRRAIELLAGPIVTPRRVIMCKPDKASARSRAERAAAATGRVLVEKDKDISLPGNLTMQDIDEAKLRDCSRSRAAYAEDVACATEVRPRPFAQVPEDPDTAEG